MGRFRKIAHIVWHCQYHFIWVTKYRYKIMEGEMKTNLNVGPKDIQTREATEENLRNAIDCESSQPVESGFEEEFLEKEN